MKLITLTIIFLKYFGVSEDCLTKSRHKERKKPLISTICEYMKFCMRISVIVALLMINCIATKVKFDFYETIRSGTPPTLYYSRIIKSVIQLWTGTIFSVYNLYSTRHLSLIFKRAYSNQIMKKSALTFIPTRRMLKFYIPAIYSTVLIVFYPLSIIYDDDDDKILLFYNYLNESLSLGLPMIYYLFYVHLLDYMVIPLQDMNTNFRRINDYLARSPTLTEEKDKSNDTKKRNSEDILRILTTYSKFLLFLLRQQRILNSFFTIPISGIIFNSVCIIIAQMFFFTISPDLVNLFMELILVMEVMQLFGMCFAPEKLDNLVCRNIKKMY